MRVHKQNEEREHRYLLEAQAKAKAEVAKLNAAKAAAARAEANEVERLNLERAKRAEKQAAVNKLSEPKTAKLARDGTVQKADRRSVTEPIHTSSLDPRTKNINSLLRAKSLASPSSYSSLRKGSINQNTTKVLQQLGVDLNPSKINESVKTSSHSLCHTSLFLVELMRQVKPSHRCRLQGNHFCES